METRLERQDRIIGSAWQRIVHAGGHILGGWLDVHASALPLRIGNEAVLKGSLNGAGATHGATAACHTLWCYVHESLLVDLCVLLGRVNLHAGSVHKHGFHQVRACSFK